jgi:hypothetical protein
VAAVEQVQELQPKGLVLQAELNVVGYLARKPAAARP